MRFFTLRLIWILFFGQAGPSCIAWRRLAEFLTRYRARFLARRCHRFIERRFGCYIASTAAIGPGLKLPHPTGIVIGAGARIGASCTIYQHVTLGGRRLGDWQKDAYPHVGNGVVLFAGAVLIGAVEIGDNCTIGANAVVLNDIESGRTAVGVPARCVDMQPDAGRMAG